MTGEYLYPFFDGSVKGGIYVASREDPDYMKLHYNGTVTIVSTMRHFNISERLQIMSYQQKEIPYSVDKSKKIIFQMLGAAKEKGESKLAPGKIDEILKKFDSQVKKNQYKPVDDYYYLRIYRNNDKENSDEWTTFFLLCLFSIGLLFVAYKIFWNEVDIRA